MRLIACRACKITLIILPSIDLVLGIRHVHSPSRAIVRSPYRNSSSTLRTQSLISSQEASSTAAYSELASPPIDLSLPCVNTTDVVTWRKSPGVGLRLCGLGAMIESDLRIQVIVAPFDAEGVQPRVKSASGCCRVVERGASRVRMDGTEVLEVYKAVPR
ncbi:hypothetical protein BC629DRAFT_1559401 [Irpex lacteus]|nr:hypothetical protein BC629DRAFT_1559401 [Irpex lacteus]